MIIYYYIIFNYLRFKRYLWGILSNKIVQLHVKFTPSRSTEDTLTDIILQRLRIWQRAIEVIRYNIMEDMKKLADKMGVDYKLSENEIEELYNERRVKDESDYA